MMRSFWSALSLVTAALASVALLGAPARAETLGDPATWNAQLGQCLVDPTRVARVEYVPWPRDYWLNECTVTRDGGMRYRLVTVTRWFIPIDQHACALAGGIATCRDYWNGAFSRWSRLCGR
jgi:hypothetical protein